MGSARTTVGARGRRWVATSHSLLDGSPHSRGRRWGREDDDGECEGDGGVAISHSQLGGSPHSRGRRLGGREDDDGRCEGDGGECKGDGG